MSEFQGFEPANTTPVPDIFFDELLAELNAAELRALLYIFRRTLGFKKSADAISFNQFLNGITTKDGKVLDKGCGIKDRTTLSKALASLEARGCIQSRKGKDPQGDKATTLYSIKFCSEVVGKSYHPSVEGSREIIPPVVVKTDYRGSKNRLPVVGKSYLQETVIQLDSLQETVIQDTYGDDASASHHHHTLIKQNENSSQKEVEDGMDTRNHGSDALRTGSRISRRSTTTPETAQATREEQQAIQAKRVENSYSPRSKQGEEDGYGVLPHELLSDGQSVRGMPGDHGIHAHGNIQSVVADTNGTTHPQLSSATRTRRNVRGTREVEQVATQQSSKSVGTSPHKERKVRVAALTPEEQLAIESDIVQAIVAEWVGIFKNKPVTEQMIVKARGLARWQPEPGEIKACRAWMYATDRNKWYEQYGMNLGHVEKEFERFRSLKDVPTQTESTSSSSWPPPGVSGGRYRYTNVARSSFDDPNFGQEQLAKEFYPEKPIVTTARAEVSYATNF